MTAIASPEYRTSFVPSEVRILSEGEKKQLVGYAAKFDVRSNLLFGEFYEIVRKGAFKKALSTNPDVRFLVNHDPSRMLARTASGTLRLREDDVGLRFEADLPNTTLGRDTAEQVSRGDLREMSFDFKKIKDTWTEDVTKKETVRELIEVTIRDVSLATYPAYPDTEASLRELRDFRDSTKVQAGTSLEMARRRLRLAEAELRG